MSGDAMGRREGRMVGEKKDAHSVERDRIITRRASVRLFPQARSWAPKMLYRPGTLFRSLDTRAGSSSCAKDRVSGPNSTFPPPLPRPLLTTPLASCLPRVLQPPPRPSRAPPSTATAASSSCSSISRLADRSSRATPTPSSPLSTTTERRPT